MTDHYLTMLMPPGSTATELKAQWKKLAAELHPDRFVRMSAKVQLSATERFAELSRAWSVLEDTKSRAVFDQERLIGKDPCAECSGAGRTSRSKGFTGKTYKACAACCGTGLQERKKRPRK